MKWSTVLFRSALGVFLMGSASVAAAQFCLKGESDRCSLAALGFVSIYLATIAFGCMGIGSYREQRASARRREEDFLRNIITG